MLYKRFIINVNNVMICSSCLWNKFSVETADTVMALMLLIVRAGYAQASLYRLKWQTVWYRVCACAWKMGCKRGVCFCARLCVQIYILIRTYLNGKRHGAARVEEIDEEIETKTLKVNGPKMDPDILLLFLSVHFLWHTTLAAKQRQLLRCSAVFFF